MYVALKLVHLVGVVMFLGNITVGVFWKSYSDRTRNPAIMAHTMDAIIRADRVFTIPGLLILLVGGFGTAGVGNIPTLSTGWILWSLIALILSGAAFSQLSRAQRQLSAAAHASKMDDYERLSKAWNFWGTTALVLPFIAFAFMILKPVLPAFHR